MQAYFFPYLGYFQLINQVDEFIIYEYVSFRKKSWMTRNRILKKGENKDILIKVPVRSANSFKIIKEIELCETDKWKPELLNLIYYNYKHSEYFDITYNLIEEIIDTNERSLHHFNSRSIEMICRHIGIITKITSVNEALRDVELSLLENAHINKVSKKSQRIIEICKVKNFTIYINPEGGQSIYDKQDFTKNDICLKFWISELPTYAQFGEAFYPALSIIDVLMHAGPLGAYGMLNNGRCV